MKETIGILFLLFLSLAENSLGYSCGNGVVDPGEQCDIGQSSGTFPLTDNFNFNYPFDLSTWNLGYRGQTRISIAGPTDDAIGSRASPFPSFYPYTSTGIDNAVKVFWGFIDTAPDQITFSQNITLPEDYSTAVLVK
jgi:hypothetical protein